MISSIIAGPALTAAVCFTGTSPALRKRLLDRSTSTLYLNATSRLLYLDVLLGVFASPLCFTACFAVLLRRFTSPLRFAMSCRRPDPGLPLFDASDSEASENPSCLALARLLRTCSSPPD